MSTAEPSGDLLAEYTLSRSLALQWTAVSTMGFVAALFGFVGVYYLATGVIVPLVVSSTGMVSIPLGIPNLPLFLFAYETGILFVERPFK